MREGKDAGGDHRVRLDPVALAQKIADRLTKISPVASNLDQAKAFLRRRRDLRRESPAKKGHEYVVELLLRPTVEAIVRQHLRIPQRDLHHHVYSSHFHTTKDSERDWKSRWKAFRRAHPTVDTQDAEKHSRRADLFIVAPNAALVSIEVKYVAAGRTPSVRQCVSQVRQHLSAHSVNLLVVYAAEPVSIRLEASMQQIFDQLVHETAFVVGIVGPPIAFD